MRSRYSAFVLCDEDYLVQTWHPGTRPDTVTADPSTTWLGLDVVDAPDPGPKRGIVEFVATYAEDGERHTLHERSRFVFQSGRWWYLDGQHSPS